jgi:uncharacterized membrane protein (DUF2068 family)
MAARRSDTVIVLIGIMKLVKSLLLYLVAVGAFSHGVRHWIDQTQPSNQHLRELITKLTNASDHTLRVIEAAALIYATLFLIEGMGLLLRKTWAEYFTTIITTSFIPLEIYEMVERGSALKAVVIAFNIAIVIYLAIRLKHDGRWPFKRSRAPEAVPGAAGI